MLDNESAAVDRAIQDLDLVVSTSKAMIRVESHRKAGGYVLKANRSGMLRLAIESLRASQSPVTTSESSDDVLDGMDALAYLSSGYKNNVIGLRVDEAIEYEELVAEEPKPQKFSWLEFALKTYLIAAVGFAVLGAVVAARWLIGLF